MKNLFFNVMLLLFGVKPKQNTLEMEVKATKFSCYYGDNLSFNEWIQYIHNEVKGGKVLSLNEKVELYRTKLMEGVC